MARKTKLQQAAEAGAAAALKVAETTGGDAEIDVDDDEYTDVLEGLHRLTEGRSATWELHCIAPPENEGMVCKLQTSQLDMAYIKGRFPPGEYKIIGRDDRGSYIRGSHKSFKLSALGSSLTPAAAESADGLGTTLQKFMDAQATREREAADRRKEMMLGLAPALAPIAAALLNRPDPMAAMAPIIAAAMNRGGEQTSMKDMLATMVSLQQLNGGGGNQLDVAFKVLERIKDLPTGEGTGWVGTVLDVLKDLAPAAKDLIGQVVEQRRGAASGQQPQTSSPAVFLPGTAAAPRPQLSANGSAPPVSSGGQHAPQSTAQTPAPASTPAAVDTSQSAASFAQSAESDMFLRIVEPWLRKQAGNVEDWAKNDVDPELAADMLLASVPMSFRRLVQPPTLLEWLNRADGWQLFVMFHPGIAPYQAWVEKLRGHLLIMLQEEIDGVPADPAGGAESVQ